MEFRFIYEFYYAKLIQFVLLDARQTAFSVVGNGNVLQPLIDAKIALVKPNVNPNIKRGNNGAIAGYFTLEINDNIPTLQQSQIRPNFGIFSSKINTQISNFIISNEWSKDYLQTG
jgi:hypothetical protein